MQRNVHRGYHFRKILLLPYVLNPCIERIKDPIHSPWVANDALRKNEDSPLRCFLFFRAVVARWLFRLRLQLANTRKFRSTHSETHILDFGCRHDIQKCIAESCDSRYHQTTCLRVKIVLLNGVEFFPWFVFFPTNKTENNWNRYEQHHGKHSTQGIVGYSGRGNWCLGSL